MYVYLTDYDVFVLQSKVIAVRRIHYPVNPSNEHFDTDTVVPFSDHFRTQSPETVLPPSDHYCIETGAPSGDHYCIDNCCTETVPLSSDHYGTTI